jgi:hypothetical protein
MYFKVVIHEKHDGIHEQMMFKLIDIEIHQQTLLFVVNIIMFNICELLVSKNYKMVFTFVIWLT